ncbi:MAG: alanine racemase, partial [Vicinamibacteria bacterium]
ANYRALTAYLETEARLNARAGKGGPAAPGIIAVVKANAYGHGAVAVARRRFVMRRHLYMAAALGATSRRTAGGHNAVLRSWRPDDAADAVRLLADAYRGESAAECFAPHGRLEEWARYVGQLLHTPGCGHFLPVGTAVARERLRNTLAGLAMVTDLAPGVAHLAQMAVAPTMRGTVSARACSRTPWTPPPTPAGTR